MRHFGWLTTVVAVWMVFSFYGPVESLAHCDTMDGPVIGAAKEALTSGNINLILIWVQPKDETEIRHAFERTVAIRKLSPEAKELADMYFFETLVRVHRAGEGAPYTGLQPAGIGVEPAVALADKAIQSDKADTLVKELNDAVSQGIQNRFKTLNEKKKHAKESVAAGREFVSAYVEFVHYVEKLHGDAAGGADEHASVSKHDHKAGHEHQ